MTAAKTETLSGHKTKKVLNTLHQISKLLALSRALADLSTFQKH